MTVRTIAVGVIAFYALLPLDRGFPTILVFGRPLNSAIAATLVALMVLVVQSRGAVLSHLREPYAVIQSLYCCVLVASALRSASPPSALHLSALYFSTFVLNYVMLRHVTKGEGARWLIAPVVAIAVAAAAVGIVQGVAPIRLSLYDAWFQSYFSRPAENYAQATARAAGTMNNPIPYSVLMALAIPYVLDLRQRAGRAIALFLIMLAAVLSGSRTAVFVVGAFVAGSLIVYRWQAIRALPAVAVGLILMAGVLRWTTPAGETDRLSFLVERSGMTEASRTLASAPAAPVPSTPVSAAGSGVAVIATDSVTGASATVTFAKIIRAGTTKMSHSSAGPALPRGWYRRISASIPYNISSTAAFTGTVTVCFDLPQEDIPTGAVLRLLHLEDNAWVDVTSGPAAASTICGTVTNFSPFVIAEALNVPTTNFIQNGGFENGQSHWLTYDNTGVFAVIGGVMEYSRPGETAVVLQNTLQPVAAGEALVATWQMGNSSDERKRFSVLLHDRSLADPSVCSFWLPPHAPLRPYAMRTRPASAWSAATISVYAASGTSGKGSYRLDDVVFGPGGLPSTKRTVCVDPDAVATDDTADDRESFGATPARRSPLGSASGMAAAGRASAVETSAALGISLRRAAVMEAFREMSEEWERFTWIAGRGAFTAGSVGRRIQPWYNTIDNVFVSVVYERGLLGLGLFVGAFMTFLVVTRRVATVTLHWYAPIALAVAGFSFEWDAYSTFNILAVGSMAIAMWHADEHKRRCEARRGGPAGNAVRP